MGSAKTKITWEGAGTRLPDGHRLFETHDNGAGVAAWAIVDRSGRLPEDSNDGVLWLDRFRCLDASTGHQPTIPVKDKDGKSFTVPSNTPAILFLSRMLKWTIQDEVRGHYYNVR
jgi:hypothetical protein